MKDTAVSPIFCGFHKCQYITSDNNGGLFNEVNMKITNALYNAGYIDNDGDYPHLIKIKKSSKTIDEIIFNLNNHLKENNTSDKCKKLVELINSKEGLGIKDNCDFKGFYDHFYLKDPGVACSGNPFEEQSEEVSGLVRSYYDIVAKEYKNKKDINLIDGLGTMEDFCCEINRVYSLIKHPISSTLKKALDKFSQDNHVKDLINTRDNDEVFYQLVKKKTDLVDPSQNPISTKENINFLKSFAPISPTAIASMQATPGNPFENEPPEVAPPELIRLRTIYSKLVEEKYRKKCVKGNKELELGDDINSIGDLCIKLSSIKNKINDSNSKAHKLLIEFIGDKEVAKLIGRVEGVTGDFYIKPIKEICSNGLLLQTMLSKYVSGVEERWSSKMMRRKKIERDLKNVTLRDDLEIELGNSSNVIVRNFPKDNNKIALILTELLKNHEFNGTFSKKIAEYLKVSGLGAYMQLQPLPGNKSHVVFNHDTPDSVNDKINDLTDLMAFMSKHLKHINTVLGDLGTRPVNASLEQLQVYYYQQMLAFDIRSSTYTEPPGSLMFAQRWIQANWDKLFGNASTQTHFGVAGESPIVTIKKLRQSFNTNLQTQNYEKSARKSPEYKIVDQGLDRIEKLAQRLEDLITKNTIPADITKNLTLALRYAMASECVELKQQSKSINFNRFFSKAKLVVPVVAALSIGVLIAGSSSVVLAPLAPFIAIGICCAAVYYLFTKCKPKLESSGVSEQLTKAMKGLVSQGDFHLASHDVSWWEAWKYHMGPIIQAFKTWWSGSVAPMPNLPEPPNPSLH